MVHHHPSPRHHPSPLRPQQCQRSMVVWRLWRRGRCQRWARRRKWWRTALPVASAASSMMTVIWSAVISAGKTAGVFCCFFPFQLIWFVFDFLVGSFLKYFLHACLLFLLPVWQVAFFIHNPFLLLLTNIPLDPMFSFIRDINVFSRM